MARRTPTNRNDLDVEMPPVRAPQRTGRRASVIAVVVVVLTVLFAGCGSDDSSSPDPAPGNESAEVDGTDRAGDGDTGDGDATDPGQDDPPGADW